MKRLEKWLTTGAYICDVSGLGSGFYIDNYTFAYEKYAPLFEILKEQTGGWYAEGEKMICLGQERTWRVQLLKEREDQALLEHNRQARSAYECVCRNRSHSARKRRI